MEFRSDVRPSPIAGAWYAGSPETLTRQVDEYLQSAKVKKEDLKGKVIGLVSPHAGHRYSGRTAAYAYKALADHPRDLVVILSPLHQFYPADFSTTAHRAYWTPLGEVEVAQEELNALDKGLSAQGLELYQVTQDEEHSLEIQLPFLQRVWKKSFRLLPVMIRVHESRKLKIFANALYESVKNTDCVIVASSDLSHYSPLSAAEALDAETLKRIQQADPEAVLAGELTGEAPACGAGAIAAMLWTTKLMGAKSVQILNYSTSADSTGDENGVVGYGAAAVLTPE
jgi:AmmeMemoRadiSam system protein B